MRTEIININADFSKAIELALNALEAGEVIAIPTDTVYGLAVDLFNAEAVKKVFALKERSNLKPLTAFISSIEAVKALCINIPEDYYTLAKEFFPGALSIILEKQSNIPDEITGGFQSISVRLPDNDFIIELLKKYKNPLATTSANISDTPSRLSATEILKDFDGKIPYIFDGGPCKHGSESTIISLLGNNPKILRSGVISTNQIEKILKRKIEE
jgi:L-threonylcarbamoyladenylate synthase